VLGVRGEPGQPDSPAKGLVWTQIVDHIDERGFDGDYVTITDLDRAVLKAHPWSLSGGGAGDVKEAMDAAGRTELRHLGIDIGMTDLTGEDDVFILPTHLRRRLPEWSALPWIVEGDRVRDLLCETQQFALLPVELDGTEPRAGRSRGATPLDLADWAIGS
jgi:hypothetical protein